MYCYLFKNFPKEYKLLFNVVLFVANVPPFITFNVSLILLFQLYMYNNFNIS